MCALRIGMRVVDNCSIVSPPMISKSHVEQVRVKGTVINTRTTIDGMVIVLLDLNGNSIMVHISVVHLHTFMFV